MPSKDEFDKIESDYKTLVSTISELYKNPYKNLNNLNNKRVVILKLQDRVFTATKNETNEKRLETYNKMIESLVMQVNIIDELNNKVFTAKTQQRMNTLNESIEKLIADSQKFQQLGGVTDPNIALKRATESQALINQFNEFIGELEKIKINNKTPEIHNRCNDLIERINRENAQLEERRQYNKDYYDANRYKSEFEDILKNCDVMTRLKYNSPELRAYGLYTQVQSIKRYKEIYTNDEKARTCVAILDKNEKELVKNFMNKALLNIDLKNIQTFKELGIMHDLCQKSTQLDDYPDAYSDQQKAKISDINFAMQQHAVTKSIGDTYSPQSTESDLENWHEDLGQASDKEDTIEGKIKSARKKIIQQIKQLNGRYYSFTKSGRNQYALINMQELADIIIDITNLKDTYKLLSDFNPHDAEKVAFCIKQLKNIQNRLKIPKQVIPNLIKRQTGLQVNLPLQQQALALYDLNPNMKFQQDPIKDWNLDSDVELVSNQYKTVVNRLVSSKYKGIATEDNIAKMRQMESDLMVLYNRIDQYINRFNDNRREQFTNMKNEFKSSYEALPTDNLNKAYSTAEGLLHDYQKQFQAALDEDLLVDTILVDYKIEPKLYRSTDIPSDAKKAIDSIIEFEKNAFRLLYQHQQNETLDSKEAQLIDENIRNLRKDVSNITENPEYHKNSQSISSLEQYVTKSQNLLPTSEKGKTSTMADQQPPEPTPQETMRSRSKFNIKALFRELLEFLNKIKKNVFQTDSFKDSSKNTFFAPSNKDKPVEKEKTQERGPKK